ncbi:MAG: hypothetical protein GY862_35300, partial [Gammaproteobacteria bacterium]|nr:hypothetical protein [Gammaproteobacteria bacterium]
MHNYLTVRIFIGLLAYAICQAGGFAQAAVNQPPVIELPPDELPDRPGYQLTTLQALGNRITITDPDAGGSDSIKVTLEAVNDTGTLEVNAAKLTDTGNISGNNSATVTFVDEMANINTVLDGMIFSPKPGFSGVAGIQVTADDQGHTGDGGPQSTSDKLDIIVEGTNVEPKINPPIGDKTVLLDADLTFTVTASDPNANTLVYALLDAAATPVTIAESNNGEFFWTPTETGTFQLFVQVTEIDGYPKNLSVQETITVTVMPPGSLAFTPPIGNQFASIDQPLAFTAQAAGVAGRTLQYSLANDPPPPAGAAIDLNTGEFFWIPTEAGTFPVTVIVTETDVSNNTRIAVETVNISVNGPPVLAVNKIVTRLDTLSFVPAAEIQDPNGNTVTLELLNPPAGASLDANGMFSWTPDTADVYSIDVKITETNGKPSNLENMGTISVAVVPINYRLTVNKSGHGTVSSSLQKINCGIVCNEIFPEEITADLRAEADPYWEFVTWGDACADAGKTQTALVPVVSAALSCTATFDLRIPQTADELRGTPLDVLGIFEARHVVQIAPAVIAELSTEQIAVLSYGAMGGLAVEQTAAIIDTVWGGLTRVNMGGFSPAAIFQFTSDDLNAFDKNEFKQMPPWDIAKFFVNLDCSKVSPLFIADFVPAGWFFDPETMVLIPPANSELMLAPLPPPEDLAENVELPEMPDLNIVFGLGNCAQGRTIVDDMNDTLMRLDYEEFTFVQQEEGILLVTGSGAYENINLAFMADADNISIEGGDAPPGAFVTPEGKIVFITPNGFRVPIIPAPKSMAVLAEAAGSDSNVKLGEEGDVLLMYRENTPLRQAAFIQEVVVFDPFLESPPEGICGDIDCGTGVYIDPKPANQSGVIYPDGVFQQI